ncbi:NAD(P)-dependent dehydrogenase, short-chain alcohol dehydrogenase family [Modicisalibacter ilicicola DSM 19980]|uniref:NAD(P)-dependent dehydrogenase, short-chain alcohol dehydrogenase family n=1 Tax=Modicisalibacter ilicicola DSM 19980 TaxID=1121942 RepID=A0A1M5EG18_9GAMM|nr:SDR family oxidoreductase [Halomonas ilicicola]SHF78169.1 NAD(P)-dependent dehydrogenase, short-chain alcohol dehydrogenase family [Halomonas ilicicola DSM 19980]
MRKRVLIAGGGELLEALSRVFLEEGATVALLTPDIACLEHVLDVLGGERSDRFGLAAGEGALDGLLGRLGRLDVLVCAPQPLPRGVPLEQRLAEQVVDPSGLLQVARAWMHSRGGGRLIAVAPDGDTQAASMVREALAALVRRLADSGDPGIRVNLLCPLGASSAAVADCARFLAGGGGRALNGQVLKLNDS